MLCSSETCFKFVAKLKTFSYCNSPYPMPKKKKNRLASYPHLLNSISLEISINISLSFQWNCRGATKWRTPTEQLFATFKHLSAPPHPENPAWRQWSSSQVRRHAFVPARRSSSRCKMCMCVLQKKRGRTGTEDARRNREWNRFGPVSSRMNHRSQ